MQLSAPKGLRLMPAVLALALFATACAPTQTAVNPPTAPSEVAPTANETAISPLVQSDAAVAPTTATASPTAGASATQAHRDFIWACTFCGGAQAWHFKDGAAQQIELPVEVYYAYGYSPITDRLLYSSPSEAIGGGPSQIAVNDLWLLDVSAGASTPIFEEQAVVEADLAPDGEHFAYVLATDTTYELRWRTIAEDVDGGEDILLASDVAFTFAVSPQSDKVAFTRESNYGLPGTPGLYVVDVATGAEIMVSDADRAGAGSIDDKPAWSPSGTRLLLPTYGTTAAPGIVLAHVNGNSDGSGAVTVGFADATQDEEWYQSPLANAFWVTDNEFLATAAPGSMNQQLGGELHLYLFRLNDAADTIIAGTEVTPGTFVGWDIPGHSIWAQVGPNMESVPLPTLPDA